jgi:hypothetical protein
VTAHIDAGNSMCEWDCDVKPMDLTVRRAVDLWDCHAGHPFQECKVILTVTETLMRAGQFPWQLETGMPLRHPHVPPVTPVDPPHSWQGLEHILTELKRWPADDREVQTIQEGKQ